jgi:hypothetical protein
LRILESGIGFQPVVVLLTGWKPTPLNYCSSGEIALRMNSKGVHQ